jgi:hypothetical protein
MENIYIPGHGTFTINFNVEDFIHNDNQIIGKPLKYDHKEFLRECIEEQGSTIVGFWWGKKRQPFTEETRKKMSDAKKRTIKEKGTDWLKRTYSDESRQKMRLAKLKTIEEKGTAWLSRPHTEETKQKMRKPKSVLPPKKKCLYCDKSYRPNWYDRHIKEQHSDR